MADNLNKRGKTGGAATLGRPIVIGAVVVLLLAVVFWRMGFAPSSQSYQEVEEVPTGAGASVEGAMGARDDGVLQPIENAERIEGSADATDLETVEDLEDPPVPVPGEGGLMNVEPEEVVDPPRGEINPETGLTVVPEEADSAEESQ